MSVAWAAAYTWRDRVSEWGQLLFASRGMLTVHTEAGLWVVPVHQAVWVPPGVRHERGGGGQASRCGRSICSHGAPAGPRRPAGRLPGGRDLATAAGDPAPGDAPAHARPAGRGGAASLDVLLDEITVLPLIPLDLPMPRDPRGVRAAAWIRAEPAARHTLAEVARGAAASARTLERLFRSETGLPFGVWRQRAGCFAPCNCWRRGSAVAGVASAVGYESTSAFVAAFRRALGTTPGRYFKKTVTAEEEGGGA